MTLLDECLIALGPNTTVLSKEETVSLFDSMSQDFAITPSGRIDWDTVKKFNRISSADEIAKHLNIKNNIVYILWDEASLPALKTTLDNVFSVINDVIPVSFDTWIYSPTEKFVIEFYHEDEINIGWGN